MHTPHELMSSRSPAPAPFFNEGPPQASPQASPQKEMTLNDLWSLLLRRKGTLLVVFSTVLLLAGVLFATSRRMYKATAEIQVQKDTADALSMNTFMGQSDAGDALEANITLQTEAQILQSDSLALSVIKTLNLENTPDFRSRFSPVGWVLGFFAPAGIADPRDVPLEEAPGRRAHMVSTFTSLLKIKPISGTRLITIEYYSSDPRTAAAVVNLLVQNLEDYNFATRHDATEQASGWLSGQLADLRKESEALQNKVLDMQHGSGVFTLGQTDNQGREQVYTPTLDRLQQATTQLASAESARIMKGALYQVVKDGDPELISSLAGNSTLSSASGGLSGSLTLLQNLRGQEAQTEAQYNQLSNKFGPAYPKLQEVQASLDTTRKSIADEANRIAARVKNDYVVAQQVEANDRAAFEQQKGQAESTNDKAVGYEIVRQEATQSRNLYENLLARLKEADLVAGMHSSNITLVDRARVPARPAKPNTVLYAAGGLAGGLILGICAALFKDATDRRIQDFAELALPGFEAPLALLPYHAKPKRLARPSRGGNASLRLLGEVEPPPPAPMLASMIAAAEPRAAYTEALRTLRTSLMQSGHGGAPPQVMLITSSIPGEGKSMLSVNLAIVYAQRGKKVLLVDGDLRTPMLHRRLGLSVEEGLTTLLSPHAAASSFRPLRVAIDGVLGLDVVPAGPQSAYPSELLGSEEMELLLRRWRAEYDYILIDGAPLLPVTDSAVLGRFADFTLVVARHGVTDRRSLERTCQILRSQGVRTTGVVLNGVRSSGGAQYSYYGYNPTTYYGSEVNA